MAAEVGRDARHRAKTKEIGNYLAETVTVVVFATIAKFLLLAIRVACAATVEMLLLQTQECARSKWSNHCKGGLRKAISQFIHFGTNRFQIPTQQLAASIDQTSPL